MTAKNMLDKQFRAADGGDYGIQVLGIIDENSICVINIRWSTGGILLGRGLAKPYPLNLFKASYRYDLSKPRSCVDAL